MSERLPIVSGKNQFLLTIGLIFLIIIFAFSILVIQNFSTPLDGVVDIFNWEYTGYFLAKILLLRLFLN